LLHAIFRDEVKIAGHQPLAARPGGRALVGATLLAPTYHPRRLEIWRALEPAEAPAAEAFWLRWNLNRGFVFAQVDLAALLPHVQGPGAPAVRVEIHSATNRFSPGTWLNDDGQPMRAGDPRFRPTFQHTHPWRMYGDMWTLFFHTTPLFDAQSTRYRAWWAGGWGLLTTGLVCWVLALQVRARLRETDRAVAIEGARDALVAAQAQQVRLSHDLHDGVIQSLYAVQLGLTQTASDVQAVAPEVGRRLHDSRAHLDAIIGELRQFIADLGAPERPGAQPGLAAVLDAIVSRLRPASAAAIELACDEPTARQFDPVQALHLASSAREALSNSLRHAHAKRITVRLAAEDEGAILELSDDGAGFDSTAAPGNGIGLVSLRRRAAVLGGTLEIKSAAGRGTTVRLRVPFKPRASTAGIAQGGGVPS
jgi:signal transduction histidine kinase